MLTSMESSPDSQNPMLSWACLKSDPTVVLAARAGFLFLRRYPGCQVNTADSWWHGVRHVATPTLTLAVTEVIGSLCRNGQWDSSVVKAFALLGVMTRVPSVAPKVDIELTPDIP